MPYEIAVAIAVSVFIVVVCVLKNRVEKYEHDTKTKYVIQVPPEITTATLRQFVQVGDRYRVRRITPELIEIEREKEGE